MRTFLGIRLECAECHNHPLDHWKRDQFWGLAAFFAGVSKQGKDNAHGAIREIADRRELAIPETTQIVKAAFLDNASPQWGRRTSGRELLAGWVTAIDGREPILPVGLQIGIRLGIELFAADQLHMGDEGPDHDQIERQEPTPGSPGRPDRAAGNSTRLPPPR